MPILRFDSPPIQAAFNEDDIRGMDVGRRQLKTEWQKALHSPSQSGENWRIVLPFPNTYKNAFESMCDVNSHPHDGKEDRLIIFLNGTEADVEPPEGVAEWVEKVGHPVAMKDFLAISFALDYDRHGGNPQKPQTEIGALRAQAKPYGDNTATAQTIEAAEKLVEHCVTFLNNMGCYASADCIVAMPPSNSSKEYNLPRYLAKRVAKEWGREDLSEHIVGEARNSIKEVPLANKFDTLRGTITIAEDVFRNRKVVLLDDVYQSGISMNHCGHLLLRSGAKKIFGLACEKTCRNDDNVSGRI
jgi:hypothetical protein